MPDVIAAAIRQLISSTNYNIVQAKNDLARMDPQTSDQFYHQGYQVGRVSAMESLVETLEMLVLPLTHAPETT